MVAIPTPRCCPPAWGSGAPARATAQPSCLQLGSKVGEDPVHAMAPLDVAGGAPVDPGGACALVAPDPVPCHQQERRVTDEVEQIIEPTQRIAGGPLVQLGLDSQYPRLRLLQRKRPLPRAGRHPRPPLL